MAERRMFAKTVVLSDTFLDLPASARCLYFILAMHADDDGFVNSPKAIMRQSGASNDDMNVLISRRFVIAFKSGTIVIRHWKQHNYLRSDRYKPTMFLEEKNMLQLANGVYNLPDDEAAMRPEDCTQSDTCAPMVYQRYADGIPTVSSSDTQDRIGQDRTGKDRVKNIYNREISEIVSYLNALTGSSYKESNKKTRTLITARLNEGFTVDDFKSVIYKKCKQWQRDANMVKYLRPETLFGSKFEGYLNEKTAASAHERLAMA